MHFRIGKVVTRRDEMFARRVVLGGQHGATRSSRRARQERLARHVFGASKQHELGWTCVPHFLKKLLPRLSRAQKTKLGHASILLLRRPPCWTSTARHARLDALDTLDTSYVSCRIETRRDERNGIRAFLLCAAAVRVAEH